MGPGRVSLWGWFEEPGPILSEVFSKPMGQVKLVWWEYPIFGHVFSKLMGWVKLVGGCRSPGIHPFRFFFKTDGAGKACLVGVPHLRTCFFKTDGAGKACLVRVPRLWACLFKFDGVRSWWERFLGAGCSIRIRILPERMEGWCRSDKKCSVYLEKFP